MNPLNPINLSQWMRLTPGTKLRSIVSGHIYEIVARTDDPFQKSYDWRIPAYMTTEGRRITFSRLWRFASSAEIEKLNSEVEPEESETDAETQDSTAQ